MKTRIPLSFLILLLFGACQILKVGNHENLTDRQLYRESIKNAIYPDSSKVDTSLVPITKQNQNLVWKNMDGVDYVLVVAWKRDASRYQPYLDSVFYDTGSYPIWVTTAPELLERMKLEKCSNTTQRLVQLLGLPPKSDYNYFVEFWVKPEDLFRPCPDEEITDRKCDLCFPANADSAHIAWINENRISRYYQCDLYKQYPWMQLGYTYDWNPGNKSHVGLSEFVIAAHCKIVVKAIYRTEDYLKYEPGLK